MQKKRPWLDLAGLRSATTIVAAILLAIASHAAQAADPIKIGFSMPPTGGLASNGKAILTAYVLMGLFSSHTRRARGRGCSHPCHRESNPEQARFFG
jgi:hypothetical protein